MPDREALRPREFVPVPAAMTFDARVSGEIEGAAARAWPASEAAAVEGWIVRRTPGVPRRRCNSLLPPADSAAAVTGLEGALATAQEMTAPAVIQVTPSEVHEALELELDRRGFVASGPTLVLARDLRAATPPVDGVAVATERLDRPWVEAWTECGGGAAAPATADRVLSQVAVRSGFLAARDPRGRVLGVGIGVLDGAWVGAFAMSVAPASRRRGVGTALMGELARWAAARGAERCYLQVEADNAEALALYGKLGFAVTHRYHYRTAPRRGGA